MTQLLNLSEVVIRIGWTTAGSPDKYHGFKDLLKWLMSEMKDCPLEIKISLRD